MPSKSENNISIIIPCWNEQRNIENGVLDEIRQYLTVQTFPWEVIIVDDGSTDKSRALIEEFIDGVEGFTLLSIPH